MFTLTEHIIKNISENGERNAGLTSLLEEFVDNVRNITGEEKEQRRKSITAYYHKILETSKTVGIAYRATYKWAILTYVQRYANKPPRSLPPQMTFDFGA